MFCSGSAEGPEEDLFLDLTPERLAFFSPTIDRFSAVHYFYHIEMEGRILFYHEAANKDGSFELRVSEVKMRRI